MIIKKSKAVVIFVKHPKQGKVKTRLALSTSDKFAVEFYLVLTKYLFNELSKLTDDYDVFLFYGKDDNEIEIKNWVGKNFIFLEQDGSDLGEKMFNAFKHVFLHEYKSAIIVGSDIPEITSEVIVESFIKLKKKDVVIAPSDDGGYSLLGLRNTNKNIFENIAWSTNTVFNQTVKRIKANEMSVGILNKLNDIDTEDELRDWLNKTKNNLLATKIKKLMEKG